MRPDIIGHKFPNAEADEVAVELDAFSIQQFCARHGLSVATFYKLKDQMPPTFRIGKRVLISRETAAAWRREREAAA